MVSFSEAVKTCMTKKFCSFSGRATRAEYWWFELFHSLAILALVAIIGAFNPKGSADEISAFIIIIFMIIMYIPSLCVTVRRLHDTEHSGMILLLCCIPYVGVIAWIYLIILLLSSSDNCVNKYGPNPNIIIKPDNESDITTLKESEDLAAPIERKDEETDITDVDL